MDNDQLNRLRWRCRRGMRELDVMLERYVQRHSDKITAENAALLSQLLDSEDDQLWDWLSGRVSCERTELVGIINDIRSTD